MNKKLYHIYICICHYRYVAKTYICIYIIYIYMWVVCIFAPVIIYIVKAYGLYEAMLMHASLRMCLKL